MTASSDGQLACHMALNWYALAKTLTATVTLTVTPTITLAPAASRPSHDQVVRLFHYMYRWPPGTRPAALPVPEAWIQARH